MPGESPPDVRMPIFVLIARIIKDAPKKGTANI
jgi:hypothetical protein